MNETLWKNNVNFVKDLGLPNIYVNLIINVVSRNKIVVVNFAQTFVSTYRLTRRHIRHDRNLHRENPRIHMLRVSLFSHPSTQCAVA